MGKRACNLSCLFVACVIAMLCGCSPLVQQPGKLHLSPSLSGDVFTTSDGASLPVRQWRPPGSPRAILVSLHGFNDYANGIASAAQDFARDGILVIAYDQRGFGKTANRGIWPGYQLLAKDAAEMVGLVRMNYPGVPLYLLGDSMGAAVALTAAVAYPLDDVKALILVAPAVWGGESFNWFYRSVLWLGAHLLRWNYVTARSFVTFSDNEAMIRAFRADPNVISKTRLDAVYGMRELMDQAQLVAPRVSLPMYVLYGEKDEVIPATAVCLFLSRVTASYQARFYPHGYHFLLRDLHSDVVRRDVSRIATSDHDQADALVLGSGLPVQCRQEGIQENKEDEAP